LTASLIACYVFDCEAVTDNGKQKNTTPSSYLNPTLSKWRGNKWRGRKRDVKSGINEFLSSVGDVAGDSCNLALSSAWGSIF